MTCYNNFTFQKIWHLAKVSVMITTGNAARRLLREKFHIKMDADMRKEINLMCNLSEAVYEDGRKSGIKRGVKRGIKRGIRRGRQAEKRRTARVMLERRYPEEEILRLVEMTPRELERVKREMETT